MTAIDILKGTYKLLSGRGNWTKGMNEHIKPNGKPCYCLAGAARKVATGSAYGDLYWNPEVRTAFEALSSVTPERNFVQFNDKKSTRKKDILSVVRKAIRLLQKKAA